MRTFMLLALLGCTDISRIEARIDKLELDVAQRKDGLRQLEERMDKAEAGLSVMDKAFGKLAQNMTDPRWWCGDIQCARDRRTCNAASKVKACEPAILAWCGVDRREGLHCFSDGNYCQTMTADGAQCVESR